MASAAPQAPFISKTVCQSVCLCVCLCVCLSSSVSGTKSNKGDRGGGDGGAAAGGGRGLVVVDGLDKEKVEEEEDFQGCQEFYFSILETH